MFDFFDLVSFLGGMLRLVGLLVFGIATGWFNLYAFRQPERRWELQTAVFLGFLLFSALTLYLASPGGAGAYVLGAGCALLYWGRKEDAAREIETEEE
jgi:ABC-type Co2+ transport system permease subunit